MYEKTNSTVPNGLSFLVQKYVESLNCANLFNQSPYIFSQRLNLYFLSKSLVVCKKICIFATDKPY